VSGLRSEAGAHVLRSQVNLSDWRINAGLRFDRHGAAVSVGPPRQQLRGRQSHGTAAVQRAAIRRPFCPFPAMLCWSCCPAASPA